MVVTDVAVLNELGLHARPIAKLVKYASSYAGSISLEKDGRQYNAASLVETLAMNAKKGDTLRLAVEGEDEDAVATNIRNMFLQRFGERN